MHYETQFFEQLRLFFEGDEGDVLKVAHPLMEFFQVSLAQAGVSRRRSGSLAEIVMKLDRVFHQGQIVEGVDTIIAKSFQTR